LGLRTVGKSPPNRLAFEQGLVKAISTGRGDPGGYFYLWKTSAVVPLLEAAGHLLVNQQGTKPVSPKANVLRGPFSHRSNGADSHEIMNGSGDMFCWVKSEKAATWVVDLLNLAERHGKLA
jgi:hypothetical protein